MCIMCAFLFISPGALSAESGSSFVIGNFEEIACSMLNFEEIACSMLNFEEIACSLLNFEEIACSMLNFEEIA